MNNKGSALILSYMVLVVLLTVSAALFSLTITEKNLTTISINSTRAFWLAEAGVQRGIWEMNYNSTPSSLDWSLSASLNQSQGDYAVSYDADSGMISSSGYYPSSSSLVKMTRMVDATVEGQSLPYFNYGAFGNTSIEFENNAEIDSYNSSQGNYSTSKCSGSNCTGNIGANGNGTSPNYAVTIENNAVIKGNVTTSGGSTSVNVDNNANVTGSTYYNVSVSLPAYAVPQDLLSLSSSGNLTLNNNAVQSLAGGNYSYNKITLDNNAKLNITGNANIYLTGTTGLNVQNNAQLNIASGAKVALYINNNFTINNNGLINNLGKTPANFILYSNYSGSTTVANNVEFYGAIYAPNTNITLSNNADTYGAVVANKLEIENNAKIHYDKALSNITDSTSNSTFAISAWKEH